MKKWKIFRFILFFSLFTFLGSCTEKEPEIYEPKADPEASQISSYNKILLDEQR